MEKNSISAIQLFSVVVCFVVGTTFIMLPTATISDAKQYGWLVHLWGAVFGVLLGSLWLYLSKLHPGLSLVEISGKVFGKYAGGAVSLLYVFLFLQIAAWVTRNLSDFMKVAMMPKTPQSVFHVMALAVCAYAAVKGIRAVSLVSIFIAPYIFIAFWTPYTIMLTEWEWRNFQIPGDFHFWPTVQETKYALGFPFMESVCFMMIFPWVGKKLKTAFLGGTAFAGLQIALSVFLAIGILGVYRSSHLLYPEYTIFREMKFSTFMEHLESIITINVLLVVFVKLSTVYSFAVSGICEIFSIRSRTAVAVPLIWVISALASFYANVTENAQWMKEYLFAYYFPFGVGIPVLLLAGTWIRKRLGRKQLKEGRIV